MTDKPKNEPFLLLTKEAANAPPRVGPTMASILELIAQSKELCGQTLKRQQQLALMVDGAISTINRRFDVLHEEQALLRVTLSRPANDNDGHIEVDVEPEPPNRVKQARAITVGLFKGTSYLTTVAVVLRLIGKSFPEYEAAIDGLLGLFGL